MGDRLGGAIFLLFLLTIDAHSTNLHVLRNVTCQSDCVTQDDDEFPCFSSPDSGCNVVEALVDSQVTPVNSPLVKVTHITVTPLLYSQYVVSLQWTLLPSDVNSTTRGLHVQWQALSSGDRCSTSSESTEVTKGMLAPNSTHCQILHFVHSPSNSPTASQVTRWCYATDDPSRCHRVTLSSLNISLSVTIRMPPNLTVIQGPLTVSEWQTPVGVVVREGRRAVITILQSAPEHLNITSYKLTLVLEMNGRTVQEHQLPQRDASYTFENITVNGIFIVRVEPLGPDCVPRCQRSVSPRIQIPGVLLAASVGPPAASSTRAATSTTPTPRSTSTTTTHNDMTVHKTTTATDPSVIVKPAVDETEYTKSRNIILGTVFGVIFLAIIATVIFCIYRRTRSVHTVGFQMQPFRRRRESNSSIIMDDALKNQPIVLLLYSYDCPAHEVVVTTFAYYLKEVGNCEVILDIWDQHNLQEQGVYGWLVDKVDIAEFIVMICSTGARFKCARNRQFRMKHDRTLPDVFAWGVDHVAEKIRTAANVSEAKTRYISAYFDYAGKSDIPPKLDITKRFCLMKDLHNLYCHLHSVKPGQTHTGSAKHGLTVDSYSKTEEGRQLQDVLIDAKHFFKEHPNWLGQTLEAITPILGSREQSNDNITEETTRLKLGPPTSPSVRPENDPFLEERKKKRLREVEGTMERIPHSKKEELAFSTPGSSPSHEPSEGSNSVTSMSPLMSPVITAKTRPVMAFTASSGTLQSHELDMDEETDADDTSQMQRDIDFIQNFDAHHTWEKRNGVGSGTSVGHFFVDVDMGIYTPPEDFISLASLEEEATRALAQTSNRASPLNSVNTSPVANSNGPNTVGVSAVTSPRKAGLLKNSPSKPSPAQSVTSIGSDKVNNSNNNGDRTFQGKVPATEKSANNPCLPPPSTSYHCSTNSVGSPVQMDIEANTRTSTTVCNSPAKSASQDTSPKRQRAQCQTKAISSSPLSSSSAASSPSPKQPSSHHSSSHSSPYKQVLTHATHSPGPHRQDAGSTNGNFVVDFEPRRAHSSENCEDTSLASIV